jgi:hypothetical protein
MVCHTYVCFDCRTTASRREYATAPLCNKCSKEMINIRGYNPPKKRDHRAWEQLRKDIQSRVRPNRIRCQIVRARPKTGHRSLWPTVYEIEKGKNHD